MNIWLYWELLKNSFIDKEPMRKMDVVEVQKLLKGVYREDGDGCSNDGDLVQFCECSAS